MVSYYRYPLDKTPLNLILDKKFLINQLYDLEERLIDNSLINYTINKNNYEINVFFDNRTFNTLFSKKQNIKLNNLISKASDIIYSFDKNNLNNLVLGG